MSDELNTRLSLGKGTLRQFFESQWLASHQGHCDLKVSRNYPDPTCLAPQKCGICILSSWLVGQWPLYTHPPSHPGACFSSLQERWAPILLLLLSLAYFIHTHPSKSVQTYPSCSVTQSRNQATITPECQSSDAKPQYAMTTNDPYSNSTCWVQHNHKWFQILHAIQMML